jgi:hypothetical protein
MFGQESRHAVGLFIVLECGDEVHRTCARLHAGKHERAAPGGRLHEGLTPQLH